MDGVKRYFVQLFKLGGDEQRYAHGALGAVEIVRASDFDAALAREAALRQNLEFAQEASVAFAEEADAAKFELAALREELAASRLNEYNAQVKMSEQHDKLTAAEHRNAAMTEALMIYTEQHERSQSVGHVEMLNIAQAALSGSLSTPSKESMVLAAWALTLNGEINANWMTAGPSKSAAEGLRDNYISRSRPCNLPKLELVPLYRTKPTESGASE